MGVDPYLLSAGRLSKKITVNTFIRGSEAE